ncbi:MAG: HDOD domain-containing protein [Steroidobacteraceae bacterium]
MRRAQQPGALAGAGDAAGADAGQPAAIGSTLLAPLLQVRRQFLRAALGLPELPPGMRATPLVAADAALRRALLNDALDTRYFPRRPMLMPQLLAVVHDANAAPRKLADIVAQDPVLAADVLKLANSAFYRRATEPVETIQRAIVVCGTDGLQSLVAAALVQPIFRSGGGPLAAFPAALWECTARCTMAAELRAQQSAPAERFSAQLLMLLDALGPLVVFRAAQVRAEANGETISAERVAKLIESCAAGVAQRIAADWNNSPRLVAALAGSGNDVLDQLREYGLLFGTLADLSLRAQMDGPTRAALLQEAGVTLTDEDQQNWARLTRA